MSAIHLRQVSKHYGRLVALDQLSLEVPVGSIFALLGPNGAGKSTTIGILGGYIARFRGEGEVLGVPLRRLYQLRGRVGILPQSASLPTQRPLQQSLEHLGRLQGWPQSQASTESRKLLEALDLGAHAHQPPPQLSFGMQKRLGLAQAFLGNPELLILDEPTAGLDPKQSHRIRQWIRDRHQPHRTILVSSHRLAELQDLCTHGAIMAGGRVVQSGTMNELRGAANSLTILTQSPLSPEDAEALRAVGHQGGVVGRQLKAEIPTHQDADAHLTELLRVLIERGHLIHSVERGHSLERAFLAATSPAVQADESPH